MRTQDEIPAIRVTGPAIVTTPQDNQYRLLDGRTMDFPLGSVVWRPEAPGTEEVVVDE